MDRLYADALKISQSLSGVQSADGAARGREELIELFNQMGKQMQDIIRNEPAIRVYSFETPREVHGEASRLIAKLRDANTQQSEFIYYIQRAYELLFNLAYVGSGGHRKHHLFVRTLVTAPGPNLAVHKIPNIDDKLDRSVMCVLLRGALLPSMIMSKEIQEYSSSGLITPFALFRIRRIETGQKNEMQHILDLKRSYYRLEELHDRDLIFADPMNATGGSLITIVNFLRSQGVKPRSIRFFTVISAFAGALRIVRSVEAVTIYTLWMDPSLNDMAYIIPGLGDAGDRLNGVDREEYPRDIIQLIADAGSTISNLYRSQVRKIEETVLRG